MMKKREDTGITKEFRKRQTRQIIAVATALFLVLLAAVIHKRPDIFGAFSRGSLFAAQAAIISVFIGFTAVNWRCPSCNKHLGGDIDRRSCRKCGARLQ
jgi:multisubunit Na+/H+ antiporter MnhB subunit